MEKMECKKAALESEFESQSCALEDLRKELMILKTQKQRSDDQLDKTKAKITELQVSLPSAVLYSCFPGLSGRQRQGAQGT